MSNFITKPSVWVLSYPMFQEHPEYKLPENGGTSSERLIAHAGKGCYDSYGTDGRAIEAHVRNLRETRHGSVFEHANISLFITGISRGCSHEIVRHRAGFAYSQRSTRYTREDNASFVLDPYYADLLRLEGLGELDLDKAFLLNSFRDRCESSLGAYALHVDTLMELAPKEKNGVERRKWARGKARQLLPHALETRMTMTGNLRAWRFFIEERSSPFAEPEIRRLAKAIFDTIYPFAPFVFEDLSDGAVTVDGFPHYRPGVPKV